MFGLVIQGLAKKSRRSTPSTCDPDQASYSTRLHTSCSEVVRIQYMPYRCLCSFIPVQLETQPLNIMDVASPTSTSKSTPKGSSGESLASPKEL